MAIISSVQNSEVKMVVSLHMAKNRKEYGLFIVEGQRACLPFIENGYKPVHSFITEKLKALPELLEKLPHTLVTESVMKKMSTAKTPSGLLLVLEIPEIPEPQDLSDGLVLANITDPGNMGTLIRSCAAFGHKSVVIINGCDPYNPKVLQSSAGTLPLVNLFQWSWKELQAYKKDFQLIALTLNSKQTPQMVTTQKNLFVIGNEAHGIDSEWIAQCDQTVTVPMPGKTESLNAGVAGSIALALYHSKN